MALNHQYADPMDVGYTGGMKLMEELRSAKAELSFVTATVEGYQEPVRHEWRMMAELLMRAPSTSKRDLAKSLGYGYHTILCWLRDARFQRYFNWLNKKEMDNLPPSMLPEISVKDIFQQYEVEMAQRLVDIAQMTGDEKLSASIAQDFLDRAGHAPRHRDSGRPLIINIAVSDLEMFQRRAQEAKLVSGNTLEERAE